MFDISIRVDGLREMISALDNITREAWHRAKVNALQDAAKVFEDEANDKVHIITGKTKNSIRVEPIDNAAKTVDIVAAWGAPYEEDRKGEHAFMTMAQEKVEGEMTGIVIREFEAMWRKNRGITPLGNRFF